MGAKLTAAQSRETPELRWFEKTQTRCTRCKKVATGILRGSRNESYGPHCEPCANHRLRDSAKARALTEEQR